MSHIFLTDLPPLCHQRYCSLQDTGTEKPKLLQKMTLQVRSWFPQKQAYYKQSRGVNLSA